jgi:hypothetical protein
MQRHRKQQSKSPRFNAGAGNSVLGFRFLIVVVYCLIVLKLPAQILNNQSRTLSAFSNGTCTNFKGAFIFHKSFTSKKTQVVSYGLWSELPIEINPVVPAPNTTTSSNAGSVQINSSNTGTCSNISAGSTTTIAPSSTSSSGGANSSSSSGGNSNSTSSSSGSSNPTSSSGTSNSGSRPVSNTQTNGNSPFSSASPKSENSNRNGRGGNNNSPANEKTSADNLRRKYFISYTKKDKSFAKKLRKLLSEKGFLTWMDEDLVAGANWQNEIDNEIFDSIAIIVILSKKALKSSYVAYEWAFGKANKKAIIPLMVKKCDLSAPFADVHYLNFTKEKKQSWNKLFETLDYYFSGDIS